MTNWMDNNPPVRSIPRKIIQNADLFCKLFANEMSEEEFISYYEVGENMTNKVIDSFTGANRWLSNFWPAPVQLDEELYPTTEHMYQAAKTVVPAERKAIREATTPGESKRLGSKCTLRPDWEEVKLKVMEDALRQKFTKDTEVGQKLIATGEAELIEGNTWGDTYWGVCKGVGKNNLGKLLMEIRADISNG